MPFQEVPGLILGAVILALAVHTVWFVHKATRQLRGEIAAWAIVRETLDAEFPKQRPPTNPPPAVQGQRPTLRLLPTGPGALLFEIARRVGAYRQALSATLVAAVAVTAVVLLADPIGRHTPGPMPPTTPGAAFADTLSESPTPPPARKVERVSAPVKEPAKEQEPQTPATPEPTRAVSPTPEPTRGATVKPKKTDRKPKKTDPPTATPTPKPRPTLVPRQLPIPTVVPTTVCVPALDVQVCVTR